MAMYMRYFWICNWNWIFKLVFQIVDKDSAVDEWRKKYEEMRNDYDMAQKNVERLQQYMADLPTSEEHSKRSHEISFTTKRRKKNIVDDTEVFSCGYQ